jgi:glycosyltransferase involved in cell wall biosynthesis
MRKVLFLACIAPNKQGSYEDFLIHLCLSSRDRGIKLSLRLNPPISEENRRRFEGSGVEWSFVKSTDFKSYSSLRKLIEKHDFGVLHFNFISACHPLIRKARLATRGKIPILLTDHSSKSQQEIQAERTKSFRWLIRLRRKLYSRLIDGCIGVSKYVLDRALNEGGFRSEQVFLIQNGVDIDRFKPHNARSILNRFVAGNESAKVVTYIGQLIHDKGIWTFLEAAYILLEKKRDLVFLIVGKGSEENKLMQVVKSSGLTDRVKFLGFMDNIELILSSTNVFVCPSAWEEAFGLVVAEAMACGVPVVASRTGGIPEIVRDGETGFLVPPGDPMAFAEAIDRILCDPALGREFSLRARERIVLEFDLERCVAHYLELYEKFFNIQKGGGLV